MRHIRIKEERHQALRLKAFDSNISIQKALDEILDGYFKSSTASEGK